MDGDETWMNAEEALDRGFVDSITAESKMAACVRHKETISACTRQFD